MGREGMIQNVHNIIIAEEGSEFHIISGCTSDTHVTQGIHIGISEFYVKDNAKLTFTMVHNWAENLVVRPRSSTRMGKNAVFMSNYVCMKPVKDIQMYPSAFMEGENGVARYNTVVVRAERLALRPGLQSHPEGEGMQGGADRQDDQPGRLHRLPRPDPGRRGGHEGTPRVPRPITG